jgi:polyisoprenyl-phosphate glycosyltransferase
MKIGDWVKALRGPIVVLGAGGFVGANLLRMLLRYRDDVYGVVRVLPAWRLDGVERRHIFEIDLTDLAATRNMVGKIGPATLFDCIAYGAYSFETDHELIYRTNFTALVQLVELLAQTNFTALVHAGSSSEYGLKSAGPLEHESLHCLRRQGAPPPRRQSPALFGLRPLRRCLPPHPEPCRQGYARRIPAIRRSRDVA